LLEVTPESAGWSNVGFRVVEVQAGAPWTGAEAGRETAIVTLEGEGTITGGGIVSAVSRRSVFDEVGRVVYFPPGTEYSVESSTSLLNCTG
jgi:5-deoxy-glucuronate isomerase